MKRKSQNKNVCSNVIKNKKEKYMADKLGIGKKLIFAGLFGIFGFIIGTLLGGTAIFPTLAWDKIGLLIGVLFGAFADELGFEF